jgi:hypothetical protein
MSCFPRKKTMARDQEINFKPYVGLFFKFCVKKPTICKRIYGNVVKNEVKYSSLAEFPEAILIIDEKRNYVRFIGIDGTSYWTRKTHIEPVSLPTHDGSPIPTLQEIRDFLVYCTHTKIMNFSIETMTSTAMNLLPKIDALIENNKLKIIPKDEN